MQKELNLKTLDKKTIYWKLDAPKGESKWLVIFVHGLTDNFDSHMLPNSAKYFTNKWYTTYRFNLYGERTQERKLGKADLKTHIKDLNTVIKHFKNIKQKIFLVWHSFGWLTILYSNIKNASWIILRDASIGSKWLLDDVTYNPKRGSYIIDRGNGYKHTIGPKMYKDFLISPKEHLKQVKKIHTPIKIICAERGLETWMEYNRATYYKSANDPKELVIISGARHHFKETWAEKKLFNETYKRIKKYS